MTKITRPCSAMPCDRPAETKVGLCLKHYKRWKRRGTTHDITTEDRFFSHVEQHGECWNWTATRLPAGYGNFAIRRSPVMAHRWAYEFLIAEIPTGLALDHLCRNTSCVNPWHLEPVTDRVNVVVRGTGITAQNARKTHCIHGHPFDLINTYVCPRGRRLCRACPRASSARWGSRRT